MVIYKLYFFLIDITKPVEQHMISHLYPIYLKMTHTQHIIYLHNYSAYYRMSILVKIFRFSGFGFEKEFR
jgi:hypothetical protein